MGVFLTQISPDWACSGLPVPAADCAGFEKCKEAGGADTNLASHFWLFQGFCRQVFPRRRAFWFFFVLPMLNLQDTLLLLTLLLLPKVLHLISQAARAKGHRDPMNDPQAGRPRGLIKPRHHR